MRTVQGPFCMECGKDLRHVESGDADLRPGDWVHVATPELPHRARPQWRVIKNAKA